MLWFTTVSQALSPNSPASTVQLAPSGAPQVHSEQLRLLSTPP